MVNSWKIVFATMVIFACGVITGALITRQQHLAAVPAVTPLSTDPAPQPAPPAYQLQKLEFLRKIQKHLDLTPEQRTRIESIMHQSQERTKPLWDQIAPQMRDEMKKVREEIRAELTPEQKKKFEALLKNRPPRKEDGGNDEKRRRTPTPKLELPATPETTKSTN